MKNQEKRIETVTLPDHSEAIVIGGFQKFKQPAIVELSVIKRLAALLATAPVDEIKEQLIEKVRAAETFVEYTGVLEDELRFQHSVNEISELSLTSK